MSKTIETATAESKKHVQDKVCHCEYCVMIDCCWGDPDLSSWERNFISNVSGYGWHFDYTEKQKTKIRQIYKKMSKMKGVS